MTDEPCQFRLNTGGREAVAFLKVTHPIDRASVQQALEGKTPRILVLRSGAIGDTLMVTPLVRALRRTFPQAYLVFLCSHRAYEMLRYNPHLDQVIPLAYRHWPIGLSLEKLRILRRLRSLKLDWALALESHPVFIDLVRRAGAARSITYGKAPADPRFACARFDPERHSIENHLCAARPLGVEPDGSTMDLEYPSAFDEVLEERLAGVGVRKGDRLVGIHAGWGGRRHPPHQTRLRSWPPQNFAGIIPWLVERVGARVVLTGSSADRPLTRLIARLSAAPCLDWAGELSLLEMTALVRRLTLYLSVDSGPAHIAAALGTPLVTLWGPGIIEQTAPFASRGPVRILYHRVPCAPCYGTPLMKICQDNVCMKQITIAEVQQAIQQVLTSRSAWKS